MHILSVQTDDRSATMLLELDDGSQRPLAYSQLRAACRCAECLALQHGGGRIEAQGVKLESLQTIGSAALNLHFSDGHARGIYPLAYLIELATRPAQ